MVKIEQIEGEGWLVRAGDSVRVATTLMELQKVLSELDKKKPAEISNDPWDRLMRKTVRARSGRITCPFIGPVTKQGYPRALVKYAARAGLSGAELVEVAKSERLPRECRDALKGYVHKFAWPAGTPSAEAQRACGWRCNMDGFKKRASND